LSEPGLVLPVDEMGENQPDDSVSPLVALRLEERGSPVGRKTTTLDTIGIDLTC
jgi:hypothetical protein